MDDELVVYLRADDGDVTFGLGIDKEEGQPSQQTDQLLMTVEPNADLSSGDTVDIVLDRAQIHLFDGMTGETIVHGLASTRNPLQTAQRFIINRILSGISTCALG